MLFLLAVSLAVAWNYSTAAGGTDLRCRIVSSRLQATGHSPYFYHWQPADGERLLDPYNNPTRKVNGNVVTPAVLTLLYPLAAMPYTMIRILWGVLQYVFLLGCVWLVAPDSFKKGARYNLATWTMTVVFACSTIWFYNIERGQVYTFYLFLFALIYRLSQLRGKYGRFIGGCVGGLSVFIRPLLGVLAIPFVVARDTRWLSGFITGLATGALVFVLTVPASWSSYSRAMEEYGNEMLGRSTYDPDAGVKDLPSRIEGMTNLRNAVAFDTGGLTTLQFYLRSRGILLSSKLLVACYVVPLLLWLYLYARGRGGTEETDRMFLFGFLLYITAELFLPGYRGSYNLVQWFFPALIISRYWPVFKKAVLVFIAGILILNGWLPAVPHLFEIAEIALFGVLTWVCLFEKKDDRTARKYV